MKWLDKLLGRKLFIVQAEFSGFTIMAHIKAKTKEDAIMRILNSDMARNRKFIRVSAWEPTEE